MSFLKLPVFVVFFVFLKIIKKQKILQKQEALGNSSKIK